MLTLVGGNDVKKYLLGSSGLFWSHDGHGATDALDSALQAALPECENKSLRFLNNFN